MAICSVEARERGRARHAEDSAVGTRPGRGSGAIVLLYRRRPTGAVLP
jgi:hypothetical protein